MLKKMIFAAGIGWLIRKFTGSRRASEATSRGGIGTRRPGRRGAW